MLERDFSTVLLVVEQAKEQLVRAVPSSRAPGHPLADSLLSFEQGLRDAEQRMDAWRDGALEREWLACRDAIVESLARAERLRLEAPELGFESLIGTIADLIAPLDVFEEANERVRALARSGLGE